MTTTTNFQRFLSDGLEAFSRGEYEQTDLRECPIKGEAESEIVRSLEGVQERLAVAAEQINCLCAWPRSVKLRRRGTTRETSR